MMDEPNWTGPFRAEGRWVHDADGSTVCLVAACADDEYRAAAIAHALNRLPEAEARIVELEAQLLTVLQRETGNIERADARMEKAEAEIERLLAALKIAGPIALADFSRHPFILNAEEKQKVATICAALKGQIDD
jgi:hypothetical protein